MTEPQDGDAAPDETLPWSVTVDPDALGPDERAVTLQPDASARAAIAARLGVDGVLALRGDLTVAPTRDGVHVRGALTARLARTCVASLEPMTEAIEEAIDLAFSKAVDEDWTPPADEAFDLDDLSVESLPEGPLDLAEILVQHLALSMAAHPRRADADAFVDKYASDHAISPFAGLKDAIKQS
ncbi:MAG: hypothetical protein AAGC56_03990 [Pseudomonadota bacterium]